MADSNSPATSRHTIKHLAGGWLLAAASVILFAWLTVGPYIRQNLRLLPGEAGITLRECSADPSCAPDAANLVDRQVTVLSQTSTVIYLSAWSVATLAVLTVAIATVLILRRQRVPLAHLLRVMWKAQIGWTAALLVLQSVVLAMGASLLAETPTPARMFTSTKAFDSPFTDAGHLYYLAWFTGIGLATGLFTRSLRGQRRTAREIRDSRGAP